MRALAAGGVTAARYCAAMSQENVETLRSFYEGLNTTGEAPTELFHDDVEIHMFEGSLFSGPYRGLDGLRRWREDSFDVLEDWGLLLDEVITGDDPNVIVVTNRFVGRARHTNLIADFRLTVVVRFRDGLIVRFEGHRERAEALAAAGLGE
jgi:ketosteroid isomerase-like protein